MKSYGIGLIILLISFVMSTYTAVVSYNYLVNSSGSLDDVKTATLIGVIASFIGIIGLLVFLVEFVKHVHGISSTKVSPPP